MHINAFFSDHKKVAMLAKTLISEMTDLTNKTCKTPEATDDVIGLQPNDCKDDSPRMTSSTLAEIESLFDAALTDSTVWPANNRPSSNVTEVGWLTSRAEPEGASSDDSKVDSLKKLRKLTATAVGEADCDAFGVLEPRFEAISAVDDVANASAGVSCSSMASEAIVVPINTKVTNSRENFGDDDEDDTRIVLPLPKRKAASDDVTVYKNPVASSAQLAGSMTSMLMRF